MITFGQWLIEQREAKGLSQNKLAERMKFSQAAVSRVEADKVEPSTAFLSAVADVLDLPIEAVYRHANILPQESKRGELENEVVHIFEQIPTEDGKRTALRLLKALLGDEKVRGVTKSVK